MCSKGRSQKMASHFSLVNGAAEPLGLLLCDPYCPHYSIEFARALPAKPLGQRAPHASVSLTGKRAQTPRMAG